MLKENENIKPLNLTHTPKSLPKIPIDTIAKRPKTTQKQNPIAIAQM